MKTRTRAALIVFVVLSVGCFLTLELAARAVYARKRVAVENVLFSSGPLMTYGEQLGWSLNEKVVHRVQTGFGDVVTYRTGAGGFRVEEGQDLAGGALMFFLLATR